MFKLSFRDLRAHLGRYILTFVAVAIGVAFIGGVLTLTDTMTRTFDDLFADINEGTDAWARGEGAFEAGFEGGGTEMRPRVDESLKDQIDQVDGVAESEASVTGYTRLIDKDGEAYGDPVADLDLGDALLGDDADAVDLAGLGHELLGRLEVE